MHDEHNGCVRINKTSTTHQDDEPDPITSRHWHVCRSHSRAFINNFAHTTPITAANPTEFYHFFSGCFMCASCFTNTFYSVMHLKLFPLCSITPYKQQNWTHNTGSAQDATQQEAGHGTQTAPADIALHTVYCFTHGCNEQTTVRLTSSQKAHAAGPRNSKMQSTCYATGQH